MIHFNDSSLMFLKMSHKHEDAHW